MSAGLLTLAIVACNLARSAWVLSGIALTYRLRIAVVRRIFHEVRPFYLAAVLFSEIAPVVFRDYHITILEAFFFGCSICCWFFYKDADKDDDDRWKRRRRKVAEKVAITNSRLAVVAGDGA